MQKDRIAAVFGGTGFIGSQVVRELAKKGWTVKVVTRVPERAYFLRPCGTVAQIVPVACDYSAESIAQAVKGAAYAVNCIGILHGKKGAFTRLHRDIPAQIAKACREEGAARFVHISALGCDKNQSRYGQSKYLGEQAVCENFPAATILRPSVVFGPGDGFFNMFARLAFFAPFLPLIGGGHTRFQPVYVGDVADAVLAALSLPSYGEQSPQGKIFELGGPEILTLKDVYERLFAYTGRRRKLVPVPWGLARLMAAFMSILPSPPLTPDQVTSLKTDNIVSEEALTLETLAIHPTGMSLILPSYLEQCRPGGRFADKKRA